jgi:hypothetical protein
MLKTLAISGIQPIVTLCENGGTSNVMVRSEDPFVPSAIPHPIFEVNCTKVSKVQLESWNVTMAKLHDFPTQPIID